MPIPLELARTADDMIRAVRRRVDQVGCTVCSDDEILDYINQGIVELHNLLITTLGDDYCSLQAPFTAYAGSGFITFNSESPYDYERIPWRLLRVSRVDPDGISRPMRTFSLSTEPLDTTPRDWNSNTPRYDWRSAAVYFNPKNDREETVTVYYIPRPPVLRIDAIEFSSVRLPPHLHQWESYAIVYAAIHAADKEEASTTVLQRELDRIKASIALTGGPKDMGTPPRIIDAQGTMADSYRPGVYPWR